MKSVKLTSQMLKDPEVLLRKAGAVVGNKAFPSRVYMNRKDYKALEKNLMSQFKKQYPYLNPKKLMSSVGMALLNLGPVDLEKGVEKGYVLVDNYGIKLEVEADSELREFAEKSIGG